MELVPRIFAPVAPEPLQRSRVRRLSSHVMRCEIVLECVGLRDADVRAERWDDVS